MPPLRQVSGPPVALGMTALVLGSVSLILFFLPILGIPLSAAGLAVGIVGIMVAFAGDAVRLRWAVLGAAVSTISLLINLAIAYAPSDNAFGRSQPGMWRPVPDRPFAPPPARPR